MRARLGLLALLLALPASAHAATYYVNVNGGNNSNSCGIAQSIATPKQTINNAVTCLSAGDTLLIRGGEYPEVLEWFGWPGGALGNNWGAAITISAYPGEAVTIKPSGSNRDYVLVMRGSGSGATNAPRYLIFNRITFDGSNVSGNYLIGVRAWDATLTPTADAPSHHIRFQDSRVTNGQAGQGYLISWGSDGVEIIGTTAGACEVDHNDGPTNVPNNTQGIYGAANDLLVENCHIHDNWGYGISNINSVAGLDNSRQIIRNNRVHDNGLGGTGLGGINLGEGDGNQIYNNLVYNNNGPGIILGFGGGSDGTLIYHNTVYNNTGIGIYIRPQDTRAVIRNNISYGNGGGNYTNTGSQTTEDHNSRTGVNPLWVNGGAGDFHLQAGSPVIDQGVVLTLASTDFGGTTRPQGTAYDLGAYEYGSGVVSSPPIITTLTLPHGAVTAGYTRPLAATGGTGVYTWTLSAGTLPPGLTLSGGGIIQGTATTAGTSNFTVRVTDASAQTATQPLSIVVLSAVTVTSSTLPNAERGAGYSVALAITGDEAPYLWESVVSAPPPGLTLSSAGVVSGIATTEAAAQFFRVRVTGALGTSAEAIVSVAVTAEYRPATRVISRNAAEGFLFRRRTAPSNPYDRVMRGDVWINTSAEPPQWNVCTTASATTAVWVPRP